MWDSETNAFHVTRDVIWLRRMFYGPDVNCDLEIGDQTVIEDLSTGNEAGAGNGIEGLNNWVVAESTDEDGSTDTEVDAKTRDWMEVTSHSGCTVRP